MYLSITQWEILFLPTAYVVREEVIFSVCLSVHRGGGGTYLSGRGGTYLARSGQGGYLPPRRGRGVPTLAGEGVPIPGRYPPARVGTPSPHPNSIACACYVVVVHAGGLSCFYQIFGGYQSYSWDHWYPYFGLLVMSALGFKARVDPFCMLSHLFDPQIHISCDTCWLYWGQHGSWAFLIHIPADVLASFGGGSGLEPTTVHAACSKRENP